MKFSRTRLYMYVTLGALLLGAGLRLYHLTADTPNYFAGLGQALMTDPYHITTFARNKVLFGSWEIFDYSRWVAFKVSLVSGFAWLVFSLGGVSRLTANLTSVLLNLFAISLLVVGVYTGRRHQTLAEADSSTKDALNKTRWMGAAVAALLLSFSHVLIIYGREPFLENGLLAISAACFIITIFAVNVTDGTNKVSASIHWRLLVIGMLLALAPLAGKLFGLILLAPVAVTVWLTSSRKWRDLAIIGASGIITAALWYLFVLGDDATQYHIYLQEQSLGLYGFPIGLTSVKFFFIQLFSYGAELRLFQFSLFLPFLVLLGFAGLLSMRIENESPWTLTFWRNRPALTFLTVWFVSAWLSLMVFQYRPLRYALFVLAPGLGVVGCLVTQLFHQRVSWSAVRAGGAKLWQKILAGFVLYVSVSIVLTQSWLATYGAKMTGDDIMSVVTFSSYIAAPLSLTLWLIARVLRRRAKQLLRVGMLALIACSILYQGYWYYLMAGNLTYDMVTASRNMESAIDKNAVLTGPYAPNLTIDNNHKNIIYSFGLKNEDTGLFSSFPITHIVGDNGSLDLAQKKFPQIKDNSEVSLWMFRAAGVRLIRLGESFPQMQEAPETALERSDHFLRIQTVGAQDSAVFYAELFVESNPDNRAGKRQLFQSLLGQKSYGLALEVGKELVNENPTDCLGHFSLARAYFYLGKYYKRKEYLAEGEVYLKRAIELNPASKKYFVENAKRF